MMTVEAQYLWDQMKRHASRFFTSEAARSLQRAKIYFGPYKEMLALREKAIAIPTDLPSTIAPRDIYTVAFNGTQVTLWNKLPRPEGSQWVGLPDEEAPVWYQHEKGAVVPAWNLFANVFGLLTFREEMEIATRDSHGRFVAEMSPRCKTGLLEVPAFNEAVALVIAGCLGLERENRPVFDLTNCLTSPGVILSHDVDILLGNDLWTQGIRFYRIFAPLGRLKRPNLANAKWIVANFKQPGKYYLDDIKRLVDAERLHGARSSFYLLNGAAGRFGARSGSSMISEAVKKIPNGWNTGMHYNYDTFLSEDRFQRQVSELSDILRARPVSGRGHYLRFDARESFRFLLGQGILCDETAGYADRIGYRCGIAGFFQPFDETQGKALPIWEIPLAIMESNLVEQYQGGAVEAFSSMLRHVSKVGGALSVLFHPGLYCNPEFPETAGLYDHLLAAIARERAVAISCRDLLNT